jgi:hypothetical protein
MSDRPATECEVDGKEIEVTPEMIEAGADILRSFNEDFESYESMAEEIFVAMISLAKRSPLSV